MARDKTRSLEWGRARRPKISNKLGNPSPREGSDGDIQVRQTGFGAKLFAKLGGRWLSNILYGNEIDDPNVFIPKAYHTTSNCPASEGDTVTVYLPSFINHENILGINFMLGVGQLSAYFVTKWSDAKRGATIAQENGIVGGNKAYQIEFEAKYIADDNTILMDSFGFQHSVLSGVSYASLMAGQLIKITVFFK